MKNRAGNGKLFAELSVKLVAVLAVGADGITVFMDEPMDAVGVASQLVARARGWA